MSILDTISAPIKTAGKTVLDFLSKPVKGIEKFIEAPDNSASGVLKNTVLGLPKAAKDVAVDVAQSIPRALGSVGLTAMNAVGIGDKEIVPNDKLSKIIYGDKPVKTIQGRTNDAQKTLEGLGFSPGFSKTLGGLGVVGGTILDLYPGTGGESAVIKKLAAEGSETIIKTIIKDNVKNISDEVIERLVPEIAKTSDSKAIKEILDRGVKESQTAVQKLTTAIKEAKPAREGVTEAQRIERGKRFATASQTQSATGGQQGYFEALSKLKGQLVPEGTAFAPVKDQLTQDEVNGLFDVIQKHPTLNFGEQLSAQDGLLKLLEGNIPQPKQLEHLEDVFGSDLIKALQSRRTLGEKAKDMVLNIINLPRSLKTTLDMSAPLRQGAVLIPGHPKISLDAFTGMFKDAFSEQSFHGFLDDLYKSPEFRTIKDSGLFVADPRKVAPGLTGREEQFMSNLLENLAGVKADSPALNKALGIVRLPGEAAKFSSRAYSSFLNRQRVGVFNDVAAAMKKDGTATEENLKALAKFVNAATGRGSLGELERATKFLSGTFFSPKFNASRLQLLNPTTYATLPAPVRKEAIKSVGAFTGTILSILSLAKLGGLSVEANPTSSDFGQIKIGDTRVDLTAGLRPWIVFIARMATGKVKTTTGGEQDLTSGKYGDKTRLDVATNFARSKLAPVPGIVGDFLAGKDVTGQPVTLKSEFLNNVSPLVAQDVADAIRQYGIKGLLCIPPAFFGAGVQTYTNKKGGAASDLLKGNSKIKLPPAAKINLKLPSGKLPTIKKLPPIK